MKTHGSKPVLVALLLVASLIAAIVPSEPAAATPGDPDYVWAKAFGSDAGGARGRAVAVMADGSTITVGAFSGTTDFNPGFGTAELTPNGSTDAYVLKLDATGKYLWARTFGGEGNDTAVDVAVDAEGNTFVTGQFQDTIDFDPGPGVSELTASREAYVLKLDHNGNFLWVRSAGYPGFQRELSSVTTDPFGNVIVATPGGNTTKFDPAGNLLWTHFPEENWHRSIATDASGNIAITGTLITTHDVDPGPGETILSDENGEDTYVIKLDPSGAVLWAVSMGGPNFDNGMDVAFDSAGNAIVVGTHWESFSVETVNGTVTLERFERGSGFIMKLDPEGNVLWATSPGPGGIEGMRVAVDGSGASYIATSFSGSKHFDTAEGLKSATAEGDLDFFVQKIDANGNAVWAEVFSGPGWDNAEDIDTDDAGNVVVSGYSDGDVDFDPSAGSSNVNWSEFTDAFVFRLGDGPPMCNGAVPDFIVEAGVPFVGSDADDVIFGTEGRDVIDGGGGNDTICGNGGNDDIIGGAGDDVVFGGEGNDKLFGRQGNDELHGDAGDDTLHGNKGDDVLAGGEGEDKIFGYANNDTIHGGPGDDRLHGNFGNDVIDGGDGNDRIFGYGDDDQITGGLGNDLIGGNFGDDTLEGGDGNDTMYGSDGTDVVDGGNGDDSLEGNSGTDTVLGGAGNDTMDGGINPDTCDGGSGTDTATRCETIRNVP